jgi:uncharacterized protein (DUF1501 family)
MNPSEHFRLDPQLISRREMLRRAGLGFGSWALLDLLARDGFAAPANPGTQSAIPLNPLAPKPPHFAAKAKNVIFLFMQGGPSHIDTFDPKPLLAKLHGQPLPPSATEGLTLRFTKMDALIHGCRLNFTRCGQSGLEISDSYPHLQKCADDLAVVRSCYHDAFNHSPAQYLMNTGSARMGRPCMGSWVTFGLGSVSENLPAFVVMATTNNTKGGPPVYGHGFLPGTYQPTVLRNSGSPILYLDALNKSADQRGILDFTQWLNREHQSARGGDTNDLDARIDSYELAFRMQAAVPDAVDLSKESAVTRELYGVDDAISGTYARSCLRARRLVERGVRFVQIFTGSAGSDDWDNAHADNDGVHASMARRIDQPTAALLQDLKERGLLESTLVVWGGEFGRTPIADGRYPDKRAGRDHNPYGFTTWLAGGGVQGGRIIGSTDEFGFRAVENPIHINDLHATILRLLGLDHKRLTFLFEGRQMRLTDVGGDDDFTSRLIS